MSRKSAVKPLSVAIGAAFITSLAATGTATAAGNPFSMTELSGGYMVADAHEGKCGGEKKDAEGKCGEGKTDADKMKSEGKCGEGKTDADKMKSEGKCGEAKCGAGK